MLIQILLLAFSSLLLWKGSDWLVESAARIGRSFNLSDLTIGLTVVAFGTSAPEFAVTINAVLDSKPDMSVGNIVGSNIFNLGFILGGCAAIRSLETTKQMVYRDGGLLVATSLLLAFFMRDYSLDRHEGAILLLGLVLYVGYLFTSSKEPQEDVPKGKATWKDYPVLLGGLVAVVAGGHFLVESASALALMWGIKEWVVAVTVVAAGTSAPEFAISLTAALKGHHGISIGNLIGSDLFTLLGVLGLAGILGPLSVSPASLGSVYLLVGMCVITVAFMRTGWIISRAEGITLIVIGVIRWAMDFLG